MNRFNSILLLIAFSLTANFVRAQDDLRWISFPDPSLEVDGAPWFEENAPDLFRLPKRLKDVVRPPVWNLATNSSGIRIRFRSDCTALGIRFENLRKSGMSNMHVFGQSGVDLYADGEYAGTAIHGKDVKVEHVYFKNASPKIREFVLYMPLYNGAKVEAVGLSKDAVIEKASPFALPKPVVYYGTSITQGGCASRGGTSYQAIASRDLNLDFVNLGFSGNGKGEKEMAEAVAEIDASCFVLDFMANNKSREELEEVYEPFVRIVRAKHPKTPMLLVTRIFTTSELAIRGGRESVEGKRDVIRNTAKKLIAEGDTNILLVEGYDLLAPSESSGLVDGSHPNDLGFQLMADRLKPILKKVLGL